MYMVAWFAKSSVDPSHNVFRDVPLSRNTLFHLPMANGYLSRWLLRCCPAVFLTVVALSSPLLAQTLEDHLKNAPAADLATLARQEGDATRGAVVFHQPFMACAKC